MEAPHPNDPGASSSEPSPEVAAETHCQGVRPHNKAGESSFLLNLTALELASSAPRIREEMIARAGIATHFGSRAHLEGFLSTIEHGGGAEPRKEGTLVRGTIRPLPQIEGCSIRQNKYEDPCVTTK